MLPSGPTAMPPSHDAQPAYVKRLSAGELAIMRSNDSPSLRVDFQNAHHGKPHLSERSNGDQDKVPPPASTTSSVSPAVLNDARLSLSDGVRDVLSMNFVVGDTSMRSRASETDSPIVGGVGPEVLHNLKSQAAQIARELRYCSEALLKVSASDMVSLGSLFSLFKDVTAGRKSMADLIKEAQNVASSFNLNPDFVEQLSRQLAEFDDGRSVSDELALDTNGFDIESDAFKHILAKVLAGRIVFCDEELERLASYAVPVRAYINERVRPLADPAREFMRSAERLLNLGGELDDLHLILGILQESGNNKAFARELLIQYLGEMNSESVKALYFGDSEDLEYKSETLNQDVERYMALMAELDFDAEKVKAKMHLLEEEARAYMNYMEGKSNTLPIREDKRRIVGRETHVLEKRLDKVIALEKDLQMNVEFTEIDGEQKMSLLKQGFSACLQRAVKMGLIEYESTVGLDKEALFHVLSSALHKEHERIDAVLLQVGQSVKLNVDTQTANERMAKVSDLIDVLPTIDIRNLVLALEDLNLLRDGTWDQVESSIRRSGKQGALRSMCGRLLADERKALYRKGVSYIPREDGIARNLEAHLKVAMETTPSSRDEGGEPVEVSWWDEDDVHEAQHHEDLERLDALEAQDEESARAYKEWVEDGKADKDLELRYADWVEKHYAFKEVPEWADADYASYVNVSDTERQKWIDDANTALDSGNGDFVEAFSPEEEFSWPANYVAGDGMTDEQRRQYEAYEAEERVRLEEERVVRDVAAALSRVAACPPELLRRAAGMVPNMIFASSSNGNLKAGNFNSVDESLPN